MITEKYKLPTGYLFISDFDGKKCETLSIGDYGKKANVKADFLGYTKPICGVENQETQPLSEKWVITLSTQYGCSMKCKFCDCPKIKFQGNLSKEDLYSQLYSAIELFPNVKYTERLNIHFARMGEGFFNFDNIYSFSEELYKNKKDLPIRVEVLHPVFTTSLPKHSKLKERLEQWVDLKNNLYNGQAGLQLSINSTNNELRNDMFNGMSCSIEQVSDIVKDFQKPVGRKYCLNFALSSNFDVDANKLKSLFDPEKWMVKITPIHNNEACSKNGYETINGYNSFEPYKEVEQQLIDVGFDVLTFVPSMDEENGLVTCGNAILSGSKLKV